MYMYNQIEMARVTGVPMTYLLTRGQAIKVLPPLLTKSSREYLFPFGKGILLRIWTIGGSVLRFYG